MQKHRKLTARLPLSAGCFLIAQAGIFICCTTTVGLCWGIIINCTYQAVSFSFKVSQNFIVYRSVEDRNLRAFFNRIKISVSCNIFTYLPKMNLFSWTVFLPEGFENGIIQRFNRPATIWREAAFHFWPVFPKKKILWKLWLWFSKMFHQRVFSD